MSDKQQDEQRGTGLPPRPQGAPAPGQQEPAGSGQPGGKSDQPAQDGGAQKAGQAPKAPQAGRDDHGFVPGPQHPQDHDRRRATIYGVLVVALILYLIYWGSSTLLRQPQVDTLATSDFVSAVKDDRVESVTYKTSDGSVTGRYWKNGDDKGKDALATNYQSYYVGTDSLQELMQSQPDITFNVDTSSDDFWETFLLSFVPTILLVIVFIYFMNRVQGQNNRTMGFGRADKARVANESRPKVTFKDVAGIDEAVEELKEVRDFLREPERYQKMGAKIPRGVLLVGPPGTGKTLLAKAVAGEAGVPFFSISGSDFVEMFVGVGASRVRDLFKQAKEAAPSIIFIDEIDAVGRQRGAGLGGGHDEREQTLNQLLVEMDGFEENQAVILIAATNRPDILDPALLRPGRFDRQITVDRPDVKGREQILKVHSENKPLARDVDFAKLAKLTPGFTGADLANLMNEAALLAARRHKDVITMDEIEEAEERVIAGPEKKGRVMTEKERKTIAYHESGHALVGHVLENSDPVHKISIIARGRALGYTLQLPEEDHFLQTRDAMLDEVATLLGGRTAEELFCDDITTGASNDLERATKIAREMVTRYGMSDELGAQVYAEASHDPFLGRDYANHSDLSAETSKRIDDEVERIMREAHQRAREVLSARRDQMDLMARVLLARETVEGEAVNALLDNKWDEYVAKHPDEAVAAPADAAKKEQQAKEDDEAIMREAASYAAQRVADEGADGAEADAGEAPAAMEGAASSGDAAGSEASKGEPDAPGDGGASDR